MADIKLTAEVELAKISYIDDKLDELKAKIETFEQKNKIKIELDRDALNKTQQQLQSILNGIQGATGNSVQSAATGIGNNISTGIADGIKEAGGAIGDAVDDAIDDALDAAGGKSKKKLSSLLPSSSEFKRINEQLDAFSTNITRLKKEIGNNPELQRWAVELEQAYGVLRSDVGLDKFEIKFDSSLTVGDFDKKIKSLNQSFATLQQAQINATKTLDNYQRTMADLDDNRLRNAISDFQDLQTAATKLSHDNKLSGADKQIAQNIVDRIKNELESITKSPGAVYELDVKADLTEFRSQLKKLGSDVKLASVGNDPFDLNEQAKKLTEIDNLIKTIQRTLRQTADYNFKGTDTQGQVDALRAYSRQLDELRDKVFNQEIGNVDYSTKWDELSVSVKQCNSELQKVMASSEKVGHTLDSSSKEYNDELRKVVKTISDLESVQRKYTGSDNAGVQGAYENVEDALDNLRKIRDNFDDTTNLNIDAGISKARLAITQFDAATKAASQTTTGFKANLKNIGTAIVGMVNVASVYNAIERAAHSVIDTVIDLDSAMTQLQIVTGATGNEMEQFMSNATQLAKDLGKSISDVTKSIEVFSRLGYNLNESSTLAEYANILSNVAAVDTNEATTGLTSIIKGFDMDVSSAEHVADVLIEVGQKYAVSASEIMEAFERGGAALHATGTSFEESAGLVAAANAAVQNASTVGKRLPIENYIG